MVESPIRPGPKDRVEHRILARKRLGRAGLIKMRPGKLVNPNPNLEKGSKLDPKKFENAT